MTDAPKWLLAYDDQLRTDAEIRSAIAVTCLGPLRLVTFAGGRGFVTYRDLGDADAAAVAGLVSRALDHYRGDPEITRVEWKTRGHDRAPGLHEALITNGFEPDEPESIMIGRTRMLDLEVPLPAGVTLRRVTAEADVYAMTAMQSAVFCDDVPDEIAMSSKSLLDRLVLEDGMELWVAEADGQVVGAGRLEPVNGTDFAGLWGGATHEAWRGQGIYRALTAARARSALGLGKTLIHSDATEYSRPVLERSRAREGRHHDPVPLASPKPRWLAEIAPSSLGLTPMDEAQGWWMRPWAIETRGLSRPGVTQPPAYPAGLFT